MGPITFTDLLSPETKRDPIAFYTHLREQGPLIPFTVPFGMGGAWIVTTFEDAIAILKVPRFTKDVHKILPPENGQNIAGPSASVMQRVITSRQDLLTVHPPDLARLPGLGSIVST